MDLRGALCSLKIIYHVSAECFLLSCNVSELCKIFKNRHICLIIRRNNNKINQHKASVINYVHLDSWFS